MSEYINVLPTDDLPVHPTEQKYIDIILQNDLAPLQRMKRELKLPLVAGALLFLLNLQCTNDAITTYVPMTTRSITHLLLFKALACALCIFILIHFQLV